MAFTSRRRFGVTLLASAAAVAFDLPRAVRAEPDVPFDASAYHHYRFPGPGLIAGSLAVQLQNNSVQTKAGAPVVALPDSPLTRAWLASSAKDIAAREPGPNEFDDPPIPDALQPFARGARAAEDGTFTFHRMPVGTFLLRGRLSIAFPRTIEVPVASSALGPQGQTIYGESATALQVFDYSYVWLDSNPVIVTATQTSNVTFQIVARRNKFDPHR